MGDRANNNRGSNEGERLCNHLRIARLTCMESILEGSVALCWYGPYGDYSSVYNVWGVVCSEELDMFSSVDMACVSCSWAFVGEGEGGGVF